MVSFIEDDSSEEEKIKEVLGFLVEQRDPYGFFYFMKSKKLKVLPTELLGSFTTLFEVEKAVKRYQATIEMVESAA